MVAQQRWLWRWWRCASHEEKFPVGLAGSNWKLLGVRVAYTKGKGRKSLDLGHRYGTSVLFRDMKLRRGFVCLGVVCGGDGTGVGVLFVAFCWY